MIIALQVVLGLVILGILVLVHELGHFIAAKSFGIRVIAFSIGFGKPLVKKTVGGTEYRISAVPFGGYVHMAGEHPEEKPEVEPGDFTAKPIWQRAVVAIAGPAANFVFAMLCLYIVFIAGVDSPAYLSRPVVGSVADSSSAMRAGIQSGDSIVAINSKAVKSWEDVEQALAYQQPKNIVIIARASGLDTAILLFSHPATGHFPKEPTGGLEPCLPPVIGATSSGSPAQKAGLVKGDTVISVNDRAIHSWYEFSGRVVKYDSLSGPILLSVKRQSAIVNVLVTPKYDKDAKRYLVGVAMAQPASKKVRYSATAAIGKMLDKTKKYTVMIFEVIGKLCSRDVSPKQLAGPVGIVQMSGFIALNGIVSCLDFMALIGINLGVLNLMPLIITDGGLLLFLLIEAVRRKPLPVSWQAMINRIAISFFILLFLYVTFNDVSRIPELIRMTGK